MRKSIKIKLFKYAIGLTNIVIAILQLSFNILPPWIGIVLIISGLFYFLLWFIEDEMHKAENARKHSELLSIFRNLK